MKREEGWPDDLDRLAASDMRRSVREKRKAKPPKVPLTDIPAGGKRIICENGRSRRRNDLRLRPLPTAQQKMEREMVRRALAYQPLIAPKDIALEARISELAGRVERFQVDQAIQESVVRLSGGNRKTEEK